MTKIIGFGGKIGSGKSTQMRFLHGYMMKHFIPNPTDLSTNFTESYQINHEGKLLVQAKFEDGEGYGEIDVVSREPEMANFLANYVWPHIKGFSFASTCKSMAAELFNVPEEAIYGTQEQKLQKIDHLRWENMPGVIDSKKFKEWDGIFELEELRDFSFESFGVLIKHGAMSGREFMQYLGTEILRRIFSNFHVNALKKSIKAFAPDYAIIDDVRFDNEREFIQSEGGIVLYLDRFDSKSKHASENSLTIDKCDAVLDTRNLDIAQSCLLVLDELHSRGIMTGASL